MRRRTVVIVATLIVIALVAAIVISATQSSSPPPKAAATGSPSEGDLGSGTSGEPDATGEEGTNGEANAGTEAGGGDPDAGEGQQERFDALAEAKADGTFGVDARIPRAATAPGWAGERVVARHYDDWEPAIAADPNAPYVYRLVTRFGGPTACPKGCPDPAIILQVSKDDGRHWGPFKFLCTCKGTHGMYDPEIEVADDMGTVQVAFMRGLSVWFVRSSDHGKTWSKPIPVFGNVSWGDKPLLASSADGKDVYVAFNGPKFGDAYVAFSHDGGKTWDQRKVTNSTRYLYAFGGQVLSDGTVVYAESSLKYRGARRLKGANRTVILRSVNGGTSWTTATVASFALGRTCTSAGCPADFYDGHTALGVDGGDRLVLSADGSLTSHGIRGVFAWTSTDGGVHWSARTRLSPGSSGAGFPAAVGTPGGEFRIWYMARLDGRWNTFYRTSADGVVWSPAVKISDAIGGAVYISPKGYREAYGDYGEIDVTDTGKTVAIWGEGASYAGPGGAWFNRET
jgi:hypothetical protein